MAQFTVTVPDTAVARIRAAVAADMGLPAPATNAELVEWARLALRRLVLQHERALRTASVEASAVQIRSGTEAAVETDFPA